MKNKLLKGFFITCVLILCIIAFAMPKTADAKQLYLVTDHETSELARYDINSDGKVSNPFFNNPYPTYGATGMAVDPNTSTLFIGYEIKEGDRFLSIVDSNLGLIRTAVDQIGDTTGIDIDDVNNVVYQTTRFPYGVEWGCTGGITMFAEAYDWDPVNKTLTAKEGNPICLAAEGYSAAYGLVVDEINSRLYISRIYYGGMTADVRVYRLGTWEPIETISLSTPPVGLAVDRVRGFVYATSPDASCIEFNPGPNNTSLSKYDLDTGVETTVDIEHGGMGIAVDEETGYVYVTGGCSKRNLTVWNSNLAKIQEIENIGPAPAGIAIANPLLYTLTVTKTGTGTVTISPSGINCGATCSAYNPETSVTLTASPTADSFFAGWSGACSGTGSNCVVTMNAAKLVTAKFTQYITVKVPDGGESWAKAPTKQTIKWEYAEDRNPGSKVTIELLKNGAVASIIARNVPIGSYGTGSYSWNIPRNQASASDYRIRITSQSNGNYTDTSNGNFTITE